MAKRFFQPGEQRAERVRDLFARIARRYDLINDLQSFGLHRRWKRRLLKLAQPRAGQCALDVCCGTGDLAIGLSKAGLKVVGLDFTAEMLAVAVGRNGSVQFILGDAQQLPFPADSFDIVTIGYGLRNLAQWKTGLEEMHRVAKPGGRLLVLDFGKPNNPVWRSLYFAYLRLFVPLLGLLICGSASAYSYILDSLKHYAAQRGVADAMVRSGLKNVRIIELLGGAMSVNYGEKAPRL